MARGSFMFGIIRGSYHCSGVGRLSRIPCTILPAPAPLTVEAKSCVHIQALELHVVLWFTWASAALMGILAEKCNNYLNTLFYVSEADPPIPDADQAIPASDPAKPLIPL